MSRQFIAALLLGSALMSGACATTAKGASVSALQKDYAAQTYVGEAPLGTTLAVVRYPAFVDPDARDAYYNAFGTQAIGGSGKQAASQERDGLADSLILKSNYFALSLYKELAAKLPEHSVLLSPHTIKLDADGKLTSVPMTQAESLPNVVTVDFAAYTYPDVTKMMGKEPLTFGDLVTPLITVKTDHRAAAPTQGVLLSSAPLMARTAGNAREAIEESMQAMQAGRLTTDPRPLDFVTFLKTGRALNVAQKSLSDRGNSHAVRAYPVEKVKLNASTLTALTSAKPAGATTADIDPLAAVFSRPMANQIVGEINRADTGKAAMAGRAGAISQFDESLAALTLVGSDDPSYLARLKYAERLLDAQKNYLSVQSLRLFDGVHNGEMGAQVRDMLKAEYNVLEKRRDLARKQNTATALAILGAIGTGVAIANSGGSGGSDCGNARSQREYNDCIRRERQRQQRDAQVNRIAIDALIAGTVYAAQTAYGSSQLSKKIGVSYLTSVAPALEEQISVQVNLIDSSETITAIRFEGLTEKLRALYSKNQRSLSVAATSCAYAHTGSSKTGTWLGECNGGFGEGSGVGILQNADGSAVEYYGYARGGQPAGPGYMITHTPTGSTALEGNFNAGRADGPMRVYAGGKSAALRTYSAGSDVGSAAGQRVASPFATRPVSVAAQSVLN